jgi:hypothetical protein
VIYLKKFDGLQSLFSIGWHDYHNMNDHVTLVGRDWGSSYVQFQCTILRKSKTKAILVTGRGGL